MPSSPGPMSLLVPKLWQAAHSRHFSAAAGDCAIRLDNGNRNASNSKIDVACLKCRKNFSEGKNFRVIPSKLYGLEMIFRLSLFL